MALTLPAKFSSLDSFTKKQAQFTREIFFQFTGEEDPVPLKPKLAKVIARWPDEKDAIIAHRRKLASKYGLMKSIKGGKEHEGAWLAFLTESGHEFNEWLTEEGAEWGTEDHPQVQKINGDPEVSWDLGDLGFVVDETIPYNIWKKISREAKSQGFLTALVPASGTIAHITTGDDGKKKAKRIPRWTEVKDTSPKEEVMSENERLKARLRELGEDI